MKYNIIRLTSLLFCLLVANFSSLGTRLRAAPLALTQEVDGASGQGTTENEARLQAYRDAIQQVVGVLVTSKNVVDNEKVIQDKILSVSNGFIDKILKEEKKQLADGTWQVNINCIVRKGELYGSLQKANVPTVKFDGTSLFADVVSQLDHQQSSVEMIKNALRKFSPDLVTATMLDEKPKIIDRNQQETTIQLTWRASVDLVGYFKNVSPALYDALSAAASEKSVQPISISHQGWDEEETRSQHYSVREIGPHNLTMYARTPFGNFIYWRDKADLAKSGSGLIAIVYPGSITVKGTMANVEGIWKANVFKIDSRILQQLDPDEPWPYPYSQCGLPLLGSSMAVIAYFKDDTGNILGGTVLRRLEFFTIAKGTKSDKPNSDERWLVCFTPFIVSSPSFDSAHHANYEESSSEDGETMAQYENKITIKNDILPKISKIDLVVKYITNDMLLKNTQN